MKPKSHKKKNPNDWVQRGISCKECNAQIFYISSMKRHLEVNHKYDKVASKEWTDEIRVQEYGEKAKELEGSKMACPVASCRAEFR